MNTTFSINEQLIKKYDTHLPRYTSYPTAPQFHEGIDEDIFCHHAKKSNGMILPKPLSLYIHVPFCHSLCYFCGCNKVVTQTTAEKVDDYVDALINEIIFRSTLFDQDRLVQQVHFGGGTPNFLSRSQLAEILDVIAKYFHLDYSPRLEIGIELDPRHSSAQSVKELAEIGFNRFSIGVQDFSMPVQLAVNRVQCMSSTIEVIEAACASANSVNVDLITGLPKQTVQSVEETINAVSDSGASRIAAYSFAYLPERIKAQKMLKAEDIPNASDRIQLAQMVDKVLLDKGYKHIGLDHYTLEHDTLYQALLDDNLQRNFQGYTTHADTDLVGFGMSSISQFETAYTQNTAHISDYIQRINTQEMPVAKGLILTADDQLRHNIIQQIMCHGKVNLAVTADSIVDGQHPIPLTQYFKSELLGMKQFEEDGIVKIQKNSFELTLKGRYFMRPVAALFDSYLNGINNLDNNITQFSRAI